ncbi:MAG: HYR domain-containing protein [Bacteroidota bacterium]
MKHISTQKLSMCTSNSRCLHASSLKWLVILLLLFGVQQKMIAQTGSALNFDGNGDQVVITNPYTAFNKEITVEWWVNIIAGTTYTLGSGIGQGTVNIDNMSNNVWLMHFNGSGSSLNFYVNEGGTWRTHTPVTIPTGWHHVVGVGDAQSVRLYIDGVLSGTPGTGIATSIFSNTGAQLHFGKDVRYSANRFMPGTMDEIRIWNRALCAGEVTQYEFCEIPTSAPGLQGNYHFNQGTGNGTNTGVTTLTDASGFGRHGTLFNMTLSGTSSNWVTPGAVTNGFSCGTFIYPTASISALGSTTVCPGGSVTLKNATSGAGYSYQWKKDGVNVGTSSSTYNATSSGTYTLVVTETGCSSTSNSVSVLVQDNTPPTFTGSMTILTPVNGAGVIVATNSSGAEVFYSLPGATDNCSASPSVMGLPASGSFFPIGTTLVTIIATDGNGNQSLTTGTITVLPIVDRDGDQIADENDLDNDNDGIPDVAECNSSNFFWSNSPTVSGSTATGTINGIGYTYTSSSSILTTSNLFSHATFPSSYNVPNATSIQNITITNNTLTFASPMTNPVLVFASIGQGGLTVPIRFGAPVQVLWSSNVVQDSSTGISGTEGYAIVRMNGTFSSISFNYLRAENYCNFAFGADFQTCGDTDNDGTPDYTDSDSDNDGCPDALEGTANFNMTQITGGMLTGGVGATGIPLIAGTGQGVGTSQVAIANCFCQGGNDQVKPIVKVKTNVFVNLGPTGVAAITAGQIDNASTDDCGIQTRSVSPSSFTCADVGFKTVTLTVTDINGNVSTGTATVQVIDNIAPTVVVQPVTVYLNAAGVATVTAAQVNNGSSDACGITSVSLDKTSFTCSNASTSNSGVLTVKTTVDNQYWAYISTNDNVQGTFVGSGNNWPTLTTYTANLVAGQTYYLHVLAEDIGGPEMMIGDFAVTGDFKFINGAQTMSTTAANWKVSSTGWSNYVAAQDVGPNGTSPWGNYPGVSAAARFIWRTPLNTTGGDLAYFTTPIIYTGNNAVLFTATDGSGNSASALANITVLDNIAPTINNCPSNISIIATSAAGTTVSYTTPGASDNCSATLARTAGPASGSVFPIGTTTVSHRATDPSGNNTTCTFTVTVSGLAPVIVNPGTISANTTAGQCKANVSYAATESTGVPASTITYSIAPGSSFNVGITAVTATATNAIGSSSTTFNVVVTDNQLPSITAPANINLNVPSCQSTPVSVALGMAVASDNCSVTTVNNAPALFPVGTTTVTWTAQDPSGNTKTATQTVTITQSAPLALAFTNDINCSGPYSGAIVANATGGRAPLQYQLNSGVFQSSNSFTNLIPGVYSLTVKDADNCSAVQNQIALVEPFCLQAVNDSFGNCAGTPITILKSTLLGNDANPWNVGIYMDVAQPANGTIVDNGNSITYTPNANFSGVDQFNYTIKKNDGTITFAGNGHVYEWVPLNGVTWHSARAAAALRYYSGMQGYLVTVTSQAEMNFVSSKLQGAGWMGASDLAYEGVWRWVTGPEGLEDFGQGRQFSGQNKYPSAYGDCSAATAPALMGQYANWAGAEPNDCGAYLNQYSPTDLNRRGEHYAHFYGQGIWNDYPNDVGGNIQGYIVEYGGMEGPWASTGTSTATVRIDNKKVIIAETIVHATCASTQNGSINLNISGGTAPYAYNWGGGITTQNRTGLATGNYSVTVTDAKGCSSSKTIAVNVVDNIAPVAVAQNIAVTLNVSGTASISASQVNNGSSDNCGIQSITVSPSAFNCSNIGANTVMLWVTDIHNNTSTTTAVVTITDVTAPTITCAVNVAANTPANACNANVTVPSPLVSDNCATSPAAAVAPFDANDSRLSLWIDATKFSTTNGASLSGVIDDASGFNRSLTTTATYDAAGFNGRPAVRYNNNQTASPSFSTNGNTYIFTTVQIVAPTNNWASVFYHWNRDAGLTIEHNAWSSNGAGPGTAPFHFQTGNDNSGVEQNITYGTNYIMVAKITGGNARSFTLYKDNGGVLQNVGTSSSSSFSLPNAIGQLFLGKSDANEYTNMRMGEFLYFQGGLPATETSIVDYLYAKWFGNSGPTVTNSINNTSNASGVYPVGTTNITWTARDASGNTSTCEQTVTVTDNIAPTISCPSNISILATSAAGATATYATPTANDNCSATVTLTGGLASGSTFPIGTTIVTYRATDPAGNNVSCSFTVTVTGLPPVIVCVPNQVVNNAAGQCGSPVSFMATETTAIPASTITYSMAPGSFFPVGTTNVTATATNSVGTSSCTFTVTVKDVTPPVLSGVPAPHLNATCDAIPAPVTVTATDNCAASPVTYFQVPTVSVNTAHQWPADGNLQDLNGTANGAAVGVVNFGTGVLGSNAFDFTGNSYINAGTSGSVSGTGDFAVSAWVRTTGTGGMTIIEQRDNDISGQYILKIGTNHNGGTHVPGKVYFLVAGNEGLGETYSAASVNDGKWHHVLGERSGSTIRIYVDGQLSATTSTGGVVTMNANGTIRTTIGADIRNIIFGAPSNHFIGRIDAVKVYHTSACASAFERDRYWIANDVALNTTAANQNLHIVDTTAPVITCPSNITATTSSACGTIVTFAATATDNCSTPTLQYSKTSGSFFPVGTTNVTVKATDVCGNQSFCTFQVTVNDLVPPTVITQNVTVQLNAGGNGSTTAAAVNNGSNDACGIATMVLSKTDFDCSNVGVNNVTLTVTDIHGNVSTADAIVTVVDGIAPIAIAQNVTVQLNAAGNGSTTAALVNNGSNDACGIASLALSQTDFNCSNVGANNVTLTITDVNGNVSTADAVVTVVDGIAPIAIAQHVTVQLNASGNGTTTAALVNNGSNDACGIATMMLSKTDFNCSNVGANDVTLTVTDVNGNISTADAVVTVVDGIAPIAIAQHVTVQLNPSGTGTTTAAQVNNGSSDACGIATIMLSKTDFNCSNVGPNNVTLTVTDVNGNVSTADAVVTVVDGIAPIAVAQNVTVQLNASGNGSTTAAAVNNGSSDACGIASLALSKTDFNCSNVGTNNVTLTVTDVNGNVSTADAVVTVIDAIAPVVITKNIAITLVNGAAGITAAQVDNGSNDACGIATRSVSPATFTCANIGNNTVTLTVTDVNGNVSSATAIVTVNGVIPSCSIAAVRSGSIIGGSNTFADPNQLYLGYGHQSMTLTATATAGGPFTYSWSGPNLTGTGNTRVFTPTAGGNYTFMCTTTNSFGCQTTCSITICVIDVRDPNSNPNNPKVIICHLPPGNPNNKQTLSIGISAVPAHVGLHGGDKLGSCNAVCGMAKDGSIGELFTEETIMGEVNLIVYPNPSSKEFNFKLETPSEELVNFKVYDMSGRVVMEYTNLSPKELIILNNLTTSGIYMAEVTQGEFRKVVKITKVD